MKPADAQDILDYLNHRNLNRWQKEFIVSIKKKVSNNQTLTDHQAMALINVYKDASGGGNYQGRQYL